MSIPIQQIAAAVNANRLWDRHMTMATFGALPGYGVCRQALTAEDIAARRQLLAWAEQCGYATAVDAIGNLFIRRPGTDPVLAPVLTGSHMDSQPRGGRFDGIYGVLAGLEVLNALDTVAAETQRAIEVVAWTNEEGGRYEPGSMGSMVFAGALALSDCLGLRDADGMLLEDALAETLASTPGLEPRAFHVSIAAYLEAHIEQGPRLEAENLPIGAVTGIQGTRWFTITVRGDTGHAGTVPLAVRRDALQGAVAVVQALNELTADVDDIVKFTVGRFNVEPNAPNSIADRVIFSVDLRHPDAAVLMRLGDAIPKRCRAAAPRCDVEVIETATNMPCEFNPAVVSAVEDVARELGLGSMRIPSGAFHDAQHMNALCPTGMIFVPCRDGVSHSPAEFADSQSLAAGAQVLAAVLYRLASSPGYFMKADEVP